MNIAVWYHCRISGHGIPDPDLALGIVWEQMQALKNSGLADAAQEIYCCINGNHHDGLLLAALVPDKAKIMVHGPESKFEFRTLHHLQLWLTDHPGWAVLYHHSKGVTQPQDSFHHHHRHVMQGFVVNNWHQCVSDLERGYDAVGCNLVHPVKRPVLPGCFFAGNFWWATSDYLSKLAPLPEAGDNRLLCESWVGSVNFRAMDYERPHLYEL